MKKGDVFTMEAVNAVNPQSIHELTQPDPLVFTAEARGKWVSKQTDKPDPLTAMVDELGDLDAELRPWRPKIARAEHLREALRARYAGAAAAETIEITGNRWVVELGACAMKKLVHVEQLARIVGAKFFAGLANVTLKALEDRKVPADIVAKCVSESQTGTRSITIMQRGTAA